MDASLITAISAIVVAVVGGGYGVINSTRANRPAESNSQLAWVKQAQEEAKEARAEAKEAKTDAAAARREADQVQDQAINLRREFVAMQDWVDRVIRARDAYLESHPIDLIHDTAELRLMRAINGGPRYLAPPPT